MIGRMITGVFFPAISLAQMPRYQQDANGYMNDVRRIQVETEFAYALANEAVEKASNGRDFIEKVSDISSWYQPPKQMGNRIDTWA